MVSASAIYSSPRRLNVIPDGLHPVEFAMKPTVVREPSTPIRHTGQFLVVSGCRPVVYRLPAASPVRPSIANGVTLSEVNEALRGRRDSWSAHAGPKTSVHSETATVDSLMGSPPLTRGRAKHTTAPAKIKPPVIMSPLRRSA